MGLLLAAPRKRKKNNNYALYRRTKNNFETASYHTAKREARARNPRSGKRALSLNLALLSRAKIETDRFARGARWALVSRLRRFNLPSRALCFSASFFRHALLESRALVAFFRVRGWWVRFERRMYAEWRLWLAEIVYEECEIVLFLI